MPTPIYSLKNIHMKNDDKNILSIKKFDFHRGTCYMINGNMASGKTTFLDILSNQKKVLKGEVQYESRRISKYSGKEYRQQYAYVPQTFKAPWGTVAKFLLKTVKHYTHNENPQKSVDDIVKKMELKEILNHKMRALTPSQLRWVVLAGNIAADTKILFIDEIELHLGRSDINSLTRILYRKCNYDGVTIIATTQNKEFFTKLTSVSITLNAGRITSVRSTNQRSNPRSGNPKRGKSTKKKK
jgi:ABC-type cobalamin/Fe3+-siderophores transport system ATPase subunit